MVHRKGFIVTVLVQNTLNPAQAVQWDKCNLDWLSSIFGSKIMAKKLKFCFFGHNLWTRNVRWPIKGFKDSYYSL